MEVLSTDLLTKVATLLFVMEDPVGSLVRLAGVSKFFNGFAHSSEVSGALCDSVFATVMLADRPQSLLTLSHTGVGNSGAQGVFAKQDISSGTPVGVYGGVWESSREYAGEIQGNHDLPQTSCFKFQMRPMPKGTAKEDSLPATWLAGFSECYAPDGYLLQGTPWRNVRPPIPPRTVPKYAFVIDATPSRHDQPGPTYLERHIKHSCTDFNLVAEPHDLGTVTVPDDGFPPALTTLQKALLANPTARWRDPGSAAFPWGKRLSAHPATVRLAVFAAGVRGVQGMQGHCHGEGGHI